MLFVPPSAWLGALRGALRLLALGRARYLVLAYHRVLPRKEKPWDPIGLVIAQEDFAAHLRWLVHFTRVAPVEEMLGEGGGGGVVLTFDDATLDFATFALPILEQYEVPATVFLPTAAPSSGRPYWWERLVASLAPPWEGEITWEGRRRAVCAANRQEIVGLLLRELRRRPASVREAFLSTLPDRAPDPWARPMTWEELEDVRRRGHTVASHTRTHAHLATASDMEIREELEGARADLTARDMTGWILAYPYGNEEDFDARALEAASEAAYRIAFAGSHRVPAGCSGRLALPRCAPGGGGASSLLIRIGNASAGAFVS